MRSLMGAVSRDLDLRDEAPLVLQRNKILMAYLDHQLAQPSTHHIRIIYGAMHMRDLEKRLRDRGLAPAPQEDKDEAWLQAFAVPLVPPLLSVTEAFTTLAPFFTLVLGLLAFDAADYVYSALTFVEPELHLEPKFIDLGLYVLRHGALYYAVTKFLVA